MLGKMREMLPTGANLRILIWQMLMAHVLLAPLSSRAAPPLPSGAEGAPASIRSKFGQPLTSDTLWWQPSDQAGPPADAIDAAVWPVTDDSAGDSVNVCRAKHAGQLVIGNSDGFQCRIASFGSSYSYAQFETLVNPNSAAHVVWTHWDRATNVATLTGAVQVGANFYVARHVRESADGEQQVHVGYLDMSSRGLILTSDAGSQSASKWIQGQVLVQVEPTEYRISRLTTLKRKMIHAESIILAHTILDNMEELAAQESCHAASSCTVATALSYVTDSNIILGSIRGMVRGLDSWLEVAGEGVEFKWAMQSAQAKTAHIHDASYWLEHGTAVNVTLSAKRVTFDAPYTALLTTAYADGKITQRPIEGHSRQTLIEDIQIHYGPAYFLANGSVVPPTTTTTTTTTPAPATTTTEEATTTTTTPTTEQPTTESPQVSTSAEPTPTPEDESISTTDTPVQDPATDAPDAADVGHDSNSQTVKAFTDTKPSSATRLISAHCLFLLSSVLILR